MSNRIIVIACATDRQAELVMDWLESYAINELGETLEREEHDSGKPVYTGINLDKDKGVIMIS